jgi:hypothetical protein
VRVIGNTLSLGSLRRLSVEPKRFTGHYRRSASGNMTATKTWIEDPADVLEMADCLLSYLDPGYTKYGFEHRRNRRAVYPTALKRAKLLLNVRSCIRNGRQYWYVDPRWRDRLELAGIDPDDLKVVDQFRWAHAWDQLTNGSTFRKADQQQRIDSGIEPPPLESIERIIECSAQYAPADPNAILPNAAFYGNGYG